MPAFWGLGLGAWGLGLGAWERLYFDSRPLIPRRLKSIPRPAFLAFALHLPAFQQFFDGSFPAVGGRGSLALEARKLDGEAKSLAVEARKLDGEAKSLAVEAPKLDGEAKSLAVDAWRLARGDESLPAKTSGRVGSAIRRLGLIGWVVEQAELRVAKQIGSVPRENRWLSSSSSKALKLSR